MTSRQARAVLALVVQHPGRTATELGQLAGDRSSLGSDATRRRFAVARRMSQLRQAGCLRCERRPGEREQRLYATKLGRWELVQWGRSDG